MANSVVIFAPYIGAGGVSRYVEGLLKAVRETTDPEEWKFRVLGQSFNSTGESLSYYDAELTNLRPPARAGWSQGAWAGYLQQHQERFRRQLLEHSSPSDLIWLVQPWWTLRGNLSNPAIGHRRFVVTLHDYAFDTLNWSGAVADAFRQEASNFSALANHLVFSSECVRSHGITHYNVPSSNSSVIYLSDFLPERFLQVNHQALAEVKARFSLPDNYALVLPACGHKGGETAVRAFAHLRRKGTRGVPTLVLAGRATELLLPSAQSTDPVVSGLRTALESEGVRYGSEYLCLGHVPDECLGALYQASSMVIAPSMSEAGLSGTIFEAFAARRPLIHSDIPAFIERLGDQNDYAVRFKTGDPLSLADAIVQIVGNPELTRERVLRAAALVVERTWHDVARDYLSVFRKVLDVDLGETRRQSPDLDDKKKGDFGTTEKPSFRSVIESPGRVSGLLSQTMTSLKMFIKNNSSGSVNMETSEFSAKEKFKDLLRSLLAKPVPETFLCPCCDASSFAANNTIIAKCMFSDLNLPRNECQKCGGIFGPTQLMHCSAHELGELYKLLYNFYKEGASQPFQEKTFYLMNPSWKGEYLNYACGDWSKGASHLRNMGWNVFGYEPFQHSTEPFIFTNKEQLKPAGFDGLISHNYLEHVQNPRLFFAECGQLLKPGSRMVHSGACFGYRYEVSPFHLFFATGESLHHLAQATGFRVATLMSCDLDFPGYQYTAATLEKLN